MNKYESYIGKKINKLTLLEILPREKSSYIYGLFECECGTIKKIGIYNVIKEKTKSCGCYRQERFVDIGKSSRKHENKCSICGHEKHYAKGMCQRCYARTKYNKIYK